MKQKHNILCIVGIIVISVGVSIGIQQIRGSEAGLANSGLEERTLTIGNTTLQAEIAQTEKQKMIGLSHRKTLAEGHGMLFIFNTNDKHGIWMKDMHFPIDIIWIDTTMKVIHIEQNISPNTYPQTFTPPTPARYILEVPAGYTKGRMRVGDMATLET